MGKFQSSKVFDGFSVVFRQWRAETNSLSDLFMDMVFHLKFTFEGELDE